MLNIFLRALKVREIAASFISLYIYNSALICTHSKWKIMEHENLCLKIVLEIVCIFDGSHFAFGKMWHVQNQWCPKYTSVFKVLGLNLHSIHPINRNFLAVVASADVKDHFLTHHFMPLLTLISTKMSKPSPVIFCEIQIKGFEVISTSW